jgi:epoxyqueuosine reductase
MRRMVTNAAAARRVTMPARPMPSLRHISWMRGAAFLTSPCPWNKFADAAARNKAFLPRAELTAPALADLLTLDDTGFRQLFSGSPIKRIGRNRFVRNCLIAAGNSGDQALTAQVRALSADSDDVVAEAARWALHQLEPTAIP